MSRTLEVGRRALTLALGLSFGAILAAETFGAAPAYADPPEWAQVWRVKHKHHHHHDDDDDDVRVIYVPQTTIIERRVTQYAPPVQYQRPVPVARGLPYGFNRGTCDRGLISSEMMGDVLGGVAGGVLGAQVGRGTGRTAATIGGTIVGVMVGGSIGRSMDNLDQGCVVGALDYLPDNRRIAWRGDAGEDYRVMPVKSYQVADGRYCREYQATAVIGGRRQQTFGTACRQPDGQWQIVD